MNSSIKHRKKKLSISIGVITKNRPEKLNICLRALINQSIKPDKIIIVDGSANNRSKDIVFNNFLQKSKSNFNYIRQKKSSISNARNIVLDNVATDLVGFIDDDGEADYKWVESMIQAHLQHPEAVIVQGQCKVVPENKVVAYVYQDEYNSWLKHNFDSKGYLIRANIENSSIKIKKLNKEIRFNEESNNYYGDDIDFSYQIISQKYKILYNPDAITKIRIRGFFSLMLKRLSKGYSAAMVDIKWKKFESQQLLILKGIPFNLNNIDNRQNSKRQMVNKLQPVKKWDKMMVAITYFFYTYLYKISYKYWYFIKSNYSWSNKDKEIYLLNSYYPNIKLKGSQLPTSTIGIIVNDQTSLGKFLPHLLAQSILPKKVFFSLHENKYLSKDLIKMVRKKIDYKIIRSGNNKLSSINKMINLCNTDIICLISSDQIPSHFWNESFIKAHKRNFKNPLIQGQRLFNNNLFSIGIVSQFLWQTFMRNSLYSGKEYYSKVLEGDKRYNKFKVIDSDNFSLKINRERINFNEKGSELETLLRVATNLLHLEKPVMMEINARTLTPKASLMQIIKSGYIMGLSLVKSSEFLCKNQNDFVSWNIPKKIMAFSYFCFRRKVYIQLPVFTFIYIMYLISFYIGILLQISRYKYGK